MIMARPFIITITTLLLVMWMASSVKSAPMSSKPKVILVSMDGFRHDYLSKVNNTPNFDMMLREGVTMPWIRNTFTTLTFPCHFTMVTGLYEESHGIVANNMYDSKTDRNRFRMSTTDDDWWTGHETIWTSAQKAGLKAGLSYESSSTNNLGIKKIFTINFSGVSNLNPYSRVVSVKVRVA